MFSQIEQIFSHIIRTRFAVSFMLMLALPIAAGAQEVTIESSPTSIMEGKTATFIISVTPAPTSNLRVNIKVTSGGPVISDSYTRPTRITVGTSGQATLTVPTVDFTEVPPPRPTEENPNPAQNANWGSVRVTIEEGNGYTVGEQGSASVYVIDEDADENPPTTVAPLPVLTLSAAPTRVAIGDEVTFTIKRTTPYDKRHRVDFRVSGHLPDITDWEPMVEILHQESANRHPPGERTYSFRVQEETCGHTPGRKIEAYLFDAYYYGDNLGINPDDAAYKVGDPSSVTIDVYAPPNWRPTGSPTISGMPEVDKVLTVSHGLSGVTGIQWIRVQGSTETNIGTGGMYTIVSADNDHRLKVKVTFNDGTCEIESALTGVVGGETPVGTIVGNPPSITEGQSKRFKITMTPAPTAPLNAEVRVSQIGDFITGSPGEGTHTVNFSTNQATATLTVNTENDQVDEEDGEISVELLSRTGYKVGDPSTATVTVNDNDNPRMTIEADTSPITEGTNAEFTITADPAPATPLTVTVSVTETRDFISGTPPSTVNFSAYQTTATLTVATDNDNIDELDGQIRAQLQSGTDYTTGSPSSATVNVEDNDMPQLSIGADQSVAESAGSMEFTVTLDGPNAQTVTVDYATSDGSATEPGDYTQRSGRLTFSPSGARTQTIRVTIRNDDIDENNENFTVTLSNASNATMGRDEATGTITDDDERGVRVDPTALNVPENGNNIYTVVLTSQPTDNVTVTVGGATGDISVSGSPLVFTTSTWRNPKTVRVNAADDTDSNSDPPVTLTHTVTGGDYAGEPAASVTVTIVENDVSTLSIDNASASESAGTMSFTVRLSVASTQPVTVDYATSNGTAIAPGDYTADNGTLTFSASSTTPQTVSVTIENDDIDEDNETFTVTLSNASNAMLAGGGSTLSATGTIQDNDTRGVRVSPTTLTVNDGSTNTYTVQLLSEPTNTVAIGVSVTDNPDVSVDKPGLTFTTNTWNTAQTVTVEAVQDEDSANDTATVQHTVSGGDYGANNVTAASVRVTVDDDETPGPPQPPTQQPPQPPTQQPPTQQPTQPPTQQPTPGTPQVTISAGTSPVTEGAAATFTITATPAPTTAVTVSVTVSETEDVITGTPDATVTIGTTGQATLTVATHDDDVDEDDSVITAQLQGGTGYTVGSPSSATVTVEDNDAPGTKGPPLPEMTITANRASVTEGTAATFTVTADPAPTTTLKVSVSISETEDVLSGTAASSVTFKANQTIVTLTVNTENDQADEPNSIVTTQLQGGTGYTVGTPSSATVTVNDNDIPQVTITANTSPVTEGIAATFTIRANPRPATPLTVNVNVTQTGDILSGTPPSSVTISTNNTTLTVATDDDDVRETAGTVMTQITAGVGYTVGTPSEASVTVNDDDTPPNHPATGAPIIIGTPELRKTLTADVSNIRDANGLENVTYAYQWIRVMGSMETEIPGATAPTYEVVTEDSGYQLKVRVNFTDDLGYPEELESALTAMVVIPGVTPVISITADPPSVTEGTAATFTITATPAPTITLTVNISVTETANTLSGTPPSTITISAGQTTLTVATDDDKTDEHASVVTAQVQAGIGYVVGTPSSARVLVLDNDLPPAIDATLSSLTINPGVMNPTFDPATLSYTALLPNATSTVTVTATPNNPDATVSINGQNTTTLDVPFTGDTMDITVTVTAVDNITQLTYTITVNRAPAGLPQVTITANPTTVTEGTAATFTITANQPSVTDLTVNVKVIETAKTLSGTPPSTVTISAGHTTATLTVATDDDDIDEHASMVKARLQAGTGYTVGDPSSASVIVLDDEVVLSTDATLSSLTINPGVLNPTFDPETLDYTVSVANGVSTITVTAIGNNSGATISINGQNATTLDVSLVEGTNTITVTVTAEDNTTQLTYTITVNREAPSTDATLSSLTINPGEPNPAFDPATLDYTASVANEVSTITVTAIANNPGAIVSINGQNATTLDVSLVEGTNTITVTVTAEDNTTQLTYTITVNRAAPVPQVTITASTTTITEGTAATFTITATPAPTITLTVNVNITETGNVLSGTPPSTITINANETTATLTVATDDDNVDEEAGVITAALQAGTGYTVGTPSSASVTVNDNDARPNNPATGAPIIIGTPEVSEILTADVSNIRDADGLENVTYIYQWIRVIDGVETEIPNATGTTYEVATVDIGHQIKVRVNFTDDLGNAEELESALTAVVVAPVVPVLTISASATSITEGTAATFTITATPAPTTALTVNVSITETGNTLSGTPPSTVTISTNQTTLTVATNDDNIDEEASAITAALQAGTGYTVGDPSSASVTVDDNDLPPNSPATGAPTIIGTPKVGEILTADVSNIRDADGLTNVSYTYQWIRLVGSAETEIIGATGVTYEVTITDVGRQLKVRVNFTDDLGYAEELESAWTAVIAPEEPRVVKLDGWLARFGRTASNHVIETVRERVRGHVGTNHVVIGGYNLDQMNYNGLFYNPTLMPGEFPMRFSIEAAQSAQSKEILKQIISSTSFALSGTLGPYSEPRWAVWGRGATTRFSGTDDDQTVEGDVTSVMLGVDYGDNCFQGGLVLSYTMGDGILGTIANTRDEWSVETTLTGVYPWARLAVTNRFSIWGMLGYGGGDLPLSLDGIKKLETDANMVMGAIGTRTDLVGSTWHDGFSLSLASDAVLSRANADDLADLLENKGTASRVRVLLEGSHVLWVSGGSLHPLAELGMRYDGGDADTGMGIEIGAGMRYVLTSLGLMIEGRVRGLIAHQEGSYEEWGGSGTIRLSPNPSGEGLSLRVSPTWGNASGSVRALWSRPDMSDIASGRNSELYSSNRVSAEVAYGVPVLGEKLVATPFVGLQDRHKRLGFGLHRGSLFGLAVEGMQYNQDLALRVRAGMHTHNFILRLEGSLDTYGHHAYFRLQHNME